MNDDKEIKNLDSQLIDDGNVVVIDHIIVKDITEDQVLIDKRGVDNAKK